MMQSASHAATIEEQSMRLAARLRPTGSFAQPQRDPFHFGARNLVPARAAASSRARAAAEPGVLPGPSNRRRFPIA